MSTDKQTTNRSNSVDSSKSSNDSHTSADEPVETHNDRYIVLCETSGREFESWYNFIKYEGNEKALEYLQKQLEKIDMYILDDFSTFDLDLDHFFRGRRQRR